MKYALISGAKSGLASSIINELQKNDYIIFACDKVITKNEIEGNIHYLSLDITDNNSIYDLCSYIKNYTDSLDLVANFAGIVILGSLVESNIDAMSKILEVNCSGIYKLNNAVFPFIKKAKGRYINISSEYGKIKGVPFHGFYPSSKHALEVYNDSLRRELLGQGIKVIAIRPGAFKTNMQQGINHQFDILLSSTNYYYKPLTKMKKMMTKELLKACNTKYFVKVFLNAALSKHPKIYYNVHNSFKMKLLSILPARLQDFIYKKYFS